MKIDPYNHKERYLKWKEKTKNGIPGLSAFNSEIVKRYLDDMERGANIASESAKGPRSYIRLNSLKEKMGSFSKRFKEIYGIDKITDITEEQAMGFFYDMQTGKIKRKDGKDYENVATHVRIFKAFWHWHQKVSKKKGIEIQDITKDLDTRTEKPKWVYLTERDVKKLCDNAKLDYRTLIMFLYDTGIRAPTELVNVKVSDLYNDCKELNIRQETSKTFGRRIKLLLCSGLLKEHIQNHNLQPNDYLFQIKYINVNKYLRRLGTRVLGDKESPAGEKYSRLTMYDFRHCACCYWLPRYKSESALKYRFGWKKSDKIHYYSELLGMKDTISEEDLLIDNAKTEIEQQLQKSNNENSILKEQLLVMQSQLDRITELTNVFFKKENIC